MQSDPFSDRQIDHPLSSTSAHYFLPDQSEPTSPYTASESTSNTVHKRTPSHPAVILYRLASDDDHSRTNLHTEASSHSDDVSRRPSTHTVATNASGRSTRQAQASYFSHQSTATDIPLNTMNSAPRGLVTYEYDPSGDLASTNDDRDERRKKSKGGVRMWLNARGISNIGMIALLVLVLLGLFLIYPIYVGVRNMNRRNLSTTQGSLPANTTNPVDYPPVRKPVDKDTPEAAKTRTGFDGQQYKLVFSDEFETPGRTFYPGDDPYLEAMDFWYGVTNDMEYYDPRQVMTRDGALVMTMDVDNARVTEPHLTPGSTAPFDAEKDNHGFRFRSGMIQSWNKFCFTSGYIEVAVLLPGKTSQKQYWPGAWVMGNLGRPGYRATTDGMWPYSYDECDVGTFPNQTFKDGSGPEAALAGVPEKGRNDDRFDHKLSVLTGQRLSACTCPNSDHPGPFGKFGNEDKPRYRGRGAPEIDILEVQHAGANGGGIGSVASQSAQFAPFSQNWEIDVSGQTIFDPARTEPNGFTGTGIQQAVSGLTKVPDEGFQLAPSRRYVTYGFEYWTNPGKRDEGFITWQVDGKKSVHMIPKAVGPDKGPNGSGVGQRIIPEEPMAIILNLGISTNWGVLDETTLDFPAEMLFDYIRIYQREGNENIGCDPPGFPTTEYIQKHIDQYTNWDTKRLWEKGVPKNSLYDGGC